jgi:hypothetical protein
VRRVASGSPPESDARKESVHNDPHDMSERSFTGALPFCESDAVTESGNDPAEVSGNAGESDAVMPRSSRPLCSRAEVARPIASGPESAIAFPRV